MSEFFSMGGDAPYVWSAYGITLAVLALTGWWVRRRHFKALERARGFAGSERARKQPTVRHVQ
jgi:heme exporter protein CcmD